MINEENKGRYGRTKKVFCIKNGDVVDDRKIYTAKKMSSSHSIVFSLLMYIFQIKVSFSRNFGSKIPSNISLKSPAKSSIFFSAFFHRKI
jgi:hypothetical protein